LITSSWPTLNGSTGSTAAGCARRAPRRQAGLPRLHRRQPGHRQPGLGRGSPGGRALRRRPVHPRARPTTSTTSSPAKAKTSTATSSTAGGRSRTCGPSADWSSSASTPHPRPRRRAGDDSCSAGEQPLWWH
jgi:hypothetical protein